MSRRWGKRTDKDKERILDDQKKKETYRKFECDPWNHPDAIKANREIMMRNEIPIWCDACRRWYDSDNYELFICTGYFIKGMAMIKARCDDCNNFNEKQMVRQNKEEELLIWMIVGTLTERGRLTDNR